tara:strand:- start:250 stop:516 length:267 start_codon:yes stop_codon:yes gene_type:complete
MDSTIILQSALNISSVHDFVGYTASLPDSSDTNSFTISTVFSAYSNDLSDGGVLQIAIGLPDGFDHGYVPNYSSTLPNHRLRIYPLPI